MVRLEDWIVIAVAGTIDATPEKEVRILFGSAYGHPRFPDGESVRTTPIAGPSFFSDEEGCHVVATASRQYALGQPCKVHLANLAEHGITYDPAQPIR